MFIKDVSILLTQIQARKSKNDSTYLAISFIDLSNGQSFDIISKEIEFMKLQPMHKFKVDLELTSSKYGIQLKIDKVKEQLGGI